jgi:hypothetical protein
MSTKDNELLQSLVEYVNDVKPYHTKFREITSELFFSDSFNANIRDTHSIEIFLQNVWDRDSIGGESLVRMCSNIDVDRFFNLPPTVYPRFTTIIKNSADKFLYESLTKRGRAIRRNRNRAKGWKIYQSYVPTRQDSILFPRISKVSEQDSLPKQDTLLIKKDSAIINQNSLLLKDKINGKDQTEKSR